ncbi:Uncharacterized protein Rs2_12202 [Raphanus sativus]|nr:Uncharacterized protein Rs2_12202 [Raphanus sativus]
MQAFHIKSGLFRLKTANSSMIKAMVVALSSPGAAFSQSFTLRPYLRRQALVFVFDLFQFILLLALYLLLLVGRTEGIHFSLFDLTGLNNDESSIEDEEISEEDVDSVEAE